MMIMAESRFSKYKFSISIINSWQLLGRETIKQTIIKAVLYEAKLSSLLLLGEIKSCEMFRTKYYQKSVRIIISIKSMHTNLGNHGRSLGV